MSETPKKIEFMMMKDSAAELVMASNVAFMDSDDSCTATIKVSVAFQKTLRSGFTYDALLFDDVNGGVDVVLCGQ